MMPLHLKSALDDYVNFRTPPGGFLEAVLENDLRESFSRADDISRFHLFDIVKYCYNDIPSACWGSRENVKNWLERKEQ